jgi:hypothetical protein
MVANGGGIKRSGVRGCETIPRYLPCPRELSLQIAMKPLCFMTACCALLFIFN